MDRSLREPRMVADCQSLRFDRVVLHQESSADRAPDETTSRSLDRGVDHHSAVYPGHCQEGAALEVGRSWRRSGLRGACRPIVGIEQIVELGEHL